MRFINLERFQSEYTNLLTQWNDDKKPFRYLVMDNFFVEEAAQKVLDEYPDTKDGKWDSTTYLHQKNKHSKTEFHKESVVSEVFSELNSVEFLEVIMRLSGIEELHGDPSLFGGGLHQSIKGAFLDVHVDYNYHPDTGEHRRLNVIIYMNKNWKDEYEGHLELWDMSKKIRIERIAPLFNRMVMFETNEVSYHGHPHPLATPNDVSRKSLAVYYYSPTRPEVEVASNHNTVYVNTEGAKGKIKTLTSGLKAIVERINK